jgi:uncharacterized membrane protein
VTNFQLSGEFADLDRDLAQVEERLTDVLAGMPLEPNYQIQVLSSLFYRNKGAYIVGKMINGSRDYPFVIPILHKRKGALLLDAVLADVGLITTLFSFTRAYFMVDMEVPSAYVKFVRSMLPNKPRSEIYTILGLQKQGKAAFYRDFLHHLEHSSDHFEVAPGIRGLVMVVSGKLATGGEVDGAKLALAIGALLGITLGTLYQKRYVEPCDVRSANVIQLMAALLVTLPFAALEPAPMNWDPELAWAMAWSVLVMTLGGSSLLYLLIQRGAATAVTSLMYLVPPTTAMIAYLLFGEAITLATVAGTFLTAVGVALVARQPRTPSPLQPEKKEKRS